MRRSLRSIGADADELLRKLGMQPGGPYAQTIERYLADAYDEVYKEGHEDGRLDQMTGQSVRITRGPYGL